MKKEEKIKERKKSKKRKSCLAQGAKGTHTRPSRVQDRAKRAAQRALEY